MLSPLRRRSSHLAAALLLGLGLGGPPTAFAADGPARRLPRWHQPPALRSIGWPDVNAAPHVHEPSWPVTLEAGRVTLVPVNPGDQLQIWGVAAHVGLASGTSETYPDAISWLGAKPPGVVRVPTWSSARFVALRTDAPARVSLEVMARSDDPLHEHRLDAAVYRWLTSDSEQMPAPISETERREFDALLALRALLERADAAAPGRDSRARASLLHSYWLRQRIVERRLVDPFFVPEPASISGGRPILPQGEERDDSRQWREIGLRTELSVRPGDADVVSFAVRARATGPSRVQIWSGPLLLHDLRLQIPRRAEGAVRWTPARIARVDVYGDAALRVVVLEGEARVAAQGYRAEPGLLEPAAAHRLRALSTQIRATGKPWLDDVIAFRLRGDEAALARLTAHWSAASDAARHAGALPPAGLAVVAAEILPALVGQSSFFPALSSFWSATSPLPAAPRDAFRSALLERLVSAFPEPVAFPAELAAPRIEGSAVSTARLLLAALLESVVLSQDGARPRALFELERAVAERASDARLVDVAHECWSRAAPWQALSAPGGIERSIVRRPDGESGMCDYQSERGLRWWIVPRTTTVFDVLDLGGTHASIRLLPLDPGAADGAEIVIDEQPIFVQPALGEESRVGLSPGAHRIQHRSGRAVIARIPRLGTAPCDQLVEMERWFALHGELVFTLPPGDAPTVASVIVDPSSLPRAGARLELAVNDSTVAGWIRAPASGDVEILVPPGATELRVRSQQPLLVRARARAHPAGERPLASLPPRELPSLDGSLAELAELTLRMRESASLERRRALRQRRAEVLFDVGYPELGAVDALRAGEPELAGRRSLPGALFLPERREAVVPLGLAAQAPLLPLASPRSIERALELDRLGYGGRALRELVAERLHEDTGGAALLSARLAAQTGDAALAAEIFERLARATGSGGLFEAAAEQYDLLASGARSIEATERAFILAKLAVRAGVRMDGLLARYSSAVEWTAPSLSSLGVSSKNVDASAADRRTDTVGSRMRRALLSTPDDARQFGDETSFNVRRWRGQTLIVESLCFNREGPDERCAAEVLVDRAPVRCESEAPASDPTLARAERCRLSLSEGASVLLVRLPVGARRMGWARLEAAGAAGGAPAPIVWQQTHAVIAQETPIRLDLVGPTVFRVSARALGTAAASLGVFDLAPAAPGGAGSEPRRVATLDFAPDDTPVAAGAEAERSSAPSELEYVVEVPGPHQLTLLALSGRLLVRPEIATIVSTPEPLGELEALNEASTAPPAATRAYDLGVTRVAPRRVRPPISLGAELSFEDRDLAESDSDRGNRFAQAGLALRRGFLSDRVWLEAGAFARVRDGAPSTGVELASGSVVDGLRPGAFANVRIVAQPAYAAVGANATFGLRQRAALGARSSLLPELGVTWRRTAPLASIQPDVDADVYSSYALRRPWSIDPKLALVHRPFLDALGRHELGARVIPDVGGVDRVEARSSVDLLAGAGWMPWLELELGASHRPSFALRRYAFTRWQVSPHATFWHWLGEGSRLRSDLDVSFFIDTPNPTGARAGVFASLVLAYDFLLGGGLGDFRPSARPFRARLEEGGPAPDPVEPPSDVYWRENAP